MRIHQTAVWRVRHKRSDIVGEPISTLPSQPFCMGISTVLSLQRSHTRGAIFDPPEFANSIRTICETPLVSCLKNHRLVRHILTPGSDLCHAGTWHDSRGA